MGIKESSIICPQCLKKSCWRRKLQIANFLPCSGEISFNFLGFEIRMKLTIDWRQTTATFLHLPSTVYILYNICMLLLSLSPSFHLCKLRPSYNNILLGVRMWLANWNSLYCQFQFQFILDQVLYFDYSKRWEDFLKNSPSGESNQLSRLFPFSFSSFSFSFSSSFSFYPFLQFT